MGSMTTCMCVHHTYLLIILLKQNLQKCEQRTRTTEYNEYYTIATGVKSQNVFNKSQHPNILIKLIFIQYMILVNAQMKRWKGEQ